MGVQNCTESNKATNAILITDHHNCGLPLTVDAFRRVILQGPITKYGLLLKTRHKQIWEYLKAIMES